MEEQIGKKSRKMRGNFVITKGAKPDCCFIIIFKRVENEERENWLGSA